MAKPTHLKFLKTELNGFFECQMLHADTSAMNKSEANVETLTQTTEKKHPYPLPHAKKGTPPTDTRIGITNTYWQLMNR